MFCSESVSGANAGCNVSRTSRVGTLLLKPELEPHAPSATTARPASAPPLGGRGAPAGRPVAANRAA